MGLGVWRPSPFSSHFQGFFLTGVVLQVSGQPLSHHLFLPRTAWRDPRVRAPREAHAGEASCQKRPWPFHSSAGRSLPARVCLTRTGLLELLAESKLFFSYPGSPSCTLRWPHLQSFTLPSRVLTGLYASASVFNAGIRESAHLRTCWWKTPSGAGWGKREVPWLPRWKPRSAKVSIQVALVNQGLLTVSGSPLQV